MSFGSGSLPRHLRFGPLTGHHMHVVNSTGIGRSAATLIERPHHGATPVEPDVESLEDVERQGRGHRCPADGIDAVHKQPATTLPFAEGFVVERYFMGRMVLDTLNLADTVG